MSQKGNLKIVHSTSVKKNSQKGMGALTFTVIPPNGFYICTYTHCTSQGNMRILMYHELSTTHEIQKK